jgi:hypothetical protein
VEKEKYAEKPKANSKESTVSMHTYTRQERIKQRI